LYDYIFDKVRTATPNQTPSKWTFGVQGELVIARRARPVATPAPLPRELQEAIDSPFAAVRAAAVNELVRLLNGRHAGLVLAARQALERLTEDDSRTVTAAARAGLTAGAPQADEVAVQVPPAEAAQPARPAHAMEEVGPAPVAAKVAPVPVAETAVAETAVAETAVAEPAVAETAVAETAVAEPAVAEPAVAEDSPAMVAEPGPPDDAAVAAATAGMPPAAVPATAPGDDRGLMVAGGLAILGAVLLVVGRGAVWESQYVVYELMLAVLALVAGVCTLRPRTRQLVGPGLLLGLLAALAWGLLLLPTDRLRRGIMSGTSWWFEVAAHLILAVAGCIAWVVLVRRAEVRLTPLPPQGRLAWLVALFGGASGVALFYHDLDLWNGFSQAADRWYVGPAVWATLMALIVPTCAVLTVPRRFGISLLAGWIGAGAAICGFSYLWDRNENGGSGTKPIIAFGITLLALLVVTVLFARAAPPSQASAGAVGEAPGSA
jgi:hypothetical protein